MNRFNDNLPPGCSINDIPGNRPEDVLWDKFMEEMHPEVDQIDNEELALKLHEEFQIWKEKREDYEV